MTVIRESGEIRIIQDHDKFGSDIWEVERKELMRSGNKMGAWDMWWPMTSQPFGSLEQAELFYKGIEQ